MYDLISIGNIVIDLFYKGESLTREKDRFHLAIGGKYFVDEFHESLGGGGANVAVGAAHFGLNTAVCGLVGENSFKQIIIQQLIKKSVSSEFIIYDKNYVNISSILLTEKGERTIINYQSPGIHLDIHPMFLETIVKTKCIFMGNLPDIPLPEREKLMQLFKDHNVQIALNFGVNDCRRKMTEIKPLLEKTDIFIVNTHEFSDLIKKDCKELDFTKDQSKEINFKEKILVVTDGEKGSYAYQNGEIYYQKALAPSKIIDTTGAGDAYTSGFLAGLHNGESVQNAMKQGAEFAKEMLGKIGAE